MPTLSIISPLASEEATVDEFLTRVVGQLGDGDRLFCVLDNASRDHTREKVAAFAARDPRVVCVWAPENRCVVDAYFRGYRAGLESSADWILEMDGGLSHIPEEIPRFRAAMATGVDFAAGSRFTKGSRYSGRLTRWLLSRGGTWMANLLLGTRMKDMTSGFECFSRKAMEFVVQRGVRSRGHFFQTEIRFMLREWSWVEVPISYACPSNRVGAGTVGEALRNLWQLRRQR